MSRISVKVEPFDRDVALIFDELLSPDARSAQLAAFALEQLEEAQAVNEQALGFVPEHETYVDRVQGAPLESVRPDGTIAFEFDLLEDVFVWISEALVRHSPWLTGRYTESHRFYADGVEVDPRAPVPAATEYVFLNVQPYARKIEKPRAQSHQAPDGVYESVAAMAGRRFGNIARIVFGYHVPIDGPIHEWATGTSASSKGHAKGDDARANWLRRQPAIIISL
jgi:hypothetical protein